MQGASPYPDLLLDESELFLWKCHPRTRRQRDLGHFGSSRARRALIERATASRAHAMVGAISKLKPRFARLARWTGFRAGGENARGRMQIRPLARPGLRPAPTRFSQDTVDKVRPCRYLAERTPGGVCRVSERARGSGQKLRSARERPRSSNASDSRATIFGTSAGCVRLTRSHGKFFLQPARSAVVARQRGPATGPYSVHSVEGAGFCGGTSPLGAKT